MFLAKAKISAIYLTSREKRFIPSVGLNVQETGLRFSAERDGHPAFMGHHLESVLSKHDVAIVPGFLATRPD